MTADTEILKIQNKIAKRREEVRLIYIHRRDNGKNTDSIIGMLRGLQMACDIAEGFDAPLQLEFWGI